MKPDKQSNNLEDVGKLKVISKSDGSFIAGWWSTDERVFVLMIYSPFLVPLYVHDWLDMDCGSLVPRPGKTRM